MPIIIDIETVQAELSNEQLGKIRAGINPRGNLKDPAKIEDDIEAKYEAILDNMALDPFHNQIVCICTKLFNPQAEWHGEEAQSKIYLGNEKLLLTNFIDYLQNDCLAPTSYPWVGVNVHGFDLPTIALHLAKHNIRPEGLTFMPSKYRRHQVIDLMTLFGEKYKSLDSLANYFGIESPDNLISGADVQERYDKGDLSAIAYHCLNDVRVTWKIYERVHSVIGELR